MVLLPRFRNCENVIRIAAMEELSYRQSRLCRLLGNPIAFTVVCLLTENKEMSTGEIAKAIHRSIPRTSNIQSGAVPQQFLQRVLNHLRWR